MKEVIFYKYEGAGNDFICLEYEILERLETLGKRVEIFEKLCHRNFGIGADGVLVAEKKKDMYCMHYFNADGQRANMCGNGMRAFRLYIYDTYDVYDETMIIQTYKGQTKVTFKSEDSIEVNLGIYPEIHTYEIDGHTYFEAYTMTDHVVRYDDEIPKAFESIGNEIGTRYDLFPTGTNVNFISPIDEQTLRLSTFERGSGATLACGTGACASALVYAQKIQKKSHDETSTVTCLTEGGILRVHFEHGTIALEGPARYVFKGIINLDGVIK